ncbi:hypothetical protein PTKIN_Ptkin07bG0238000 [Pterospermum kingtungense]
MGPHSLAPKSQEENDQLEWSTKKSKRDKFAIGTQYVKIVMETLEGEVPLCTPKPLGSAVNPGVSFKETLLGYANRNAYLDEEHDVSDDEEMVQEKEDEDFPVIVVLKKKKG